MEMIRYCWTVVVAVAVFRAALSRASVLGKTVVLDVGECVQTVKLPLVA